MNNHMNSLEKFIKKNYFSTIIPKAKEQCYGYTNTYNFTETCVEIKLKDLLDFTGQRFSLYLEDTNNTETKRTFTIESYL